MNLQNNLEKLEYNKILEMLSSLCVTFIGKDLACNLQPYFNKDKVEKSLNETSEADVLKFRKGNPPIDEIEDIGSSLKKLQSNICLSEKELLDIAYIFRLSRDLKDYFFKDENFDISSFPILEVLFTNLYCNLDIEKAISSAIIDSNTVADNASNKLFAIRKNLKNLETDIKDSLNKILHSPSYSKAIMEPVVTIRNDRYVIPIKEEYRSVVKGFIHDISSSGSTVFIEPIQVFELNNKLQTLKIDEAVEVEHILEDLSNKITPFISQLENDVNLIGRLDFIFAKANLAKNMNANLPTLNDNKQINLRKARHPLIDSTLVVPIDIKIGDNYSCLIITGPNTGGKTVTLKTCGLLCLMAYSGLFIPAEENSSIYVFDNIFADIGDEQSIQESLSTFSSHMTNIINILDKATSNSLILIDELGSGTDPIEGSSLAISILEYIRNLDATCLTTTHYPEIKNYALVTDGFENASSEFDVENLRPTFKLLIGIPGKSNAFAISKRLGLNEKILSRAKELLNEDDINIEDLLKNIYDDKIIIEKEKEEIEKNHHQIEALRKSLEKEKQNQVNSKNDAIEKAESMAKELLISTKEEANEIIQELNLLHNNFKELENIDLDNLSDKEIANLVRMHFKKGTLKNANILRNKLNDSLKKASSTGLDEKSNKKDISLISKENLKIGMKVKLTNFQEPATIISLSGKKDQMQVQIGNAKMSVKLTSIENVINNKPSKNYTDSVVSSGKTNSTFKAKNISPEINVIGQNVEEACFTVDKYLDNCYLAKLSTVRIVHGKGTGKLRQGIHNFLKNNPHVKSYRLGTFGEGEMGVTVVELK